MTEVSAFLKITIECRCSSCFLLFSFYIKYIKLNTQIMLFSLLYVEALTFKTRFIKQSSVSSLKNIYVLFIARFKNDIRLYLLVNTNVRDFTLFDITVKNYHFIAQLDWNGQYSKSENRSKTSKEQRNKQTHTTNPKQLMQLLLIIDIMRLFFLIKITEARRFIDLLELILTT